MASITTPWTFKPNESVVPTEANGGVGSYAGNPGEGTWSGGTGQAPVNVGYVYDRGQGVWGAIYKDTNTGKYYHNGQELPGWNDATAQANLGATQQAMTNEKNNKNFGTALDKFGDSLGPGIALLPLAIAAISGSLGTNIASGAFSGASTTGGEASFGSLAATDSGLTSATTATANAAAAQGASVAPGYVSAQGALEAAVGNAANASIVPGSLSASSAPGLISSLEAGAAGGLATSAVDGSTSLPGSGVTDEQLLTGQANGVDSGLGQMPAGDTGFTTGPGAIDFSGAAKVIGKELLKDAVKTAVKTAIVGTPGATTRPGVDVAAPPDIAASFASLGAQSFGSTLFQPLTRTKFQVDTKALADAGVEYTPRG